jgi:hypothetical protein
VADEGVNAQAVGKQTPTDEDRQRYGRLLDSAYARGLIDDGEYSLRLTELVEADSTERMNQIVELMPSSLDAVDLARLAAPKTATNLVAKRRRTALIAIAFMFLILIVLGVLLAISVHDHQNGLGALVGILGIAVTMRSVGGVFGV